MKIPEYQADKLASSLVGTPGQDQSGAMIGNAVTKAAGQVEDATFKLAVKRQQVADETAANLIEAETRVQAETMAAKNDVKYADWGGAPEERMALTKPEYDEFFSAQLEKVKSPGARQILERKFSAMGADYAISEAKRGRETQAFLIGKNYNETVNVIASQAAELGKDRTLSLDQRLGSLQYYLNAATQAYQTAAPGLSTEARQKYLTMTPEAISKAMLSGMLSHSPEQVEQALKSEQFNGVLSAEERKKYEDAALDAIPKVRARVEREKVSAALAGKMELNAAVQSGSPDAMKLIEQADTDDSVKKNLRAIVYSGNKATVNDAKAKREILGRIEALYKPYKKGDPKTLKGSAKLEDLDAIINQAVAYQSQGLLTGKFVESMQTKLAVPYYNFETSGGKQTRGDWMLGLWQNAMDTVGSWFKQTKQPEDAQDRVTDELLDGFDPTTVKTPQDAATLARTAIQNEAARQYPGMNTVEGTKNGVLDANKRKVAVQEGPTTAKPAARISGVGVEVVEQKSKDGKRVYSVTYENGKFVRKDLKSGA